MKKLLYIQNDPTVPPHHVGLWFAEMGFENVILRADQGESVPTKVPDGIAAIIPLGGSMAAWESDKFPWLEDEYALIRDAVAKEIPVLGICLGAQLMAHALGGKVERGQKSEIGVHEIFNAAKSSEHLFNFPKPIKAALYHQDFVTELPPQAELIASSELCTNQIFRIGQKSYALQMHPEVDAQLFKAWEDDDNHEVVGFDGVSKVNSVKAVESELLANWKTHLQAWGELISK